MEELLASNTRLEADKTRTDKEMRSMVRVKDKLDLEKEQLSKENDQLLTAMNALQESNSQLEAENKSVKYESNQFQIENNRYETEINSLVQKVEKHLQVQQQLFTEKLSLEELVERLTREIQAIKMAHERESQFQASLPQHSPTVNLG